ncbi:MAG: peptidylprolyl isomerase [Desulfobacterales bacterium]
MKIAKLITMAMVIIGLAVPALADNPQVRLETTKGLIVLELNPQAAPETVENFLTYVREGYYDGTIFHRVIKDFMIQGGGMMPGMVAKAGRAPIRNEANNGLKNKKGTIAMARTGNPHSATSQFFINVRDNFPLDFKSRSRSGWGYCVFGQVIQGMNVVERIEMAPTMKVGGYEDVPKRAIIIEKAVVVTP